MPNAKVACYIDGFNLYHAIKSLPPPCQHLKWINLWGLASAFVQHNQEQLVDVYYFSALALWLPEPQRRHKMFIAANRALGVTPVLGCFKAKKQRCQSCGAEWIAHEEKQSDVNLAIHLVHHAALCRYDRALVVSADSDMCSAIDLVLAAWPQKQVRILTPPGRYNIAQEIREKVRTSRIKPQHLERNLLPKTLTDAEGNVIHRPAKYAPPR